MEGGQTDRHIPAPALIPLAGLASRAGGSCSEGSGDWSSGVCVCKQRSLSGLNVQQMGGGGGTGGEGIISMDHLSLAAGCPHNKEEEEEGPRMVLVHVGYLVLPVFGSVRNRGMTSCMFLLLSFLFIYFYPNPNPTKMSPCLYLF